MRQPPSLAAVLTKLAASGIAVPPGRVGLDTYGDTPELSHALVALIRDGPKRAGTSLLWAHEHEGERLPEVGDVDVVVDHEGEPVAVTRVVSVQVTAFDQVDAAYAALEGEGDGSLAHWRAAHWDIFGRECASERRAAVSIHAPEAPRNLYADDCRRVETTEEAPMDHDFEKLGALYLGGELDAASGERRGMLLLDARDLTTHGVIISEHDPVGVRPRLAPQVERGDPGTRVSVVAGEGGRV